VWNNETAGTVQNCSEQFDFAFHIHSLPFGKLVEFDRGHLEQVFECLAVQMALQVTAVDLIGQILVRCLQLAQVEYLNRHGSAQTWARGVW
jgi:hypothetical protein